jgi:hypothetical protein
LQIKAKKGKGDMRTSIVSFLLCLPHLSAWLCDHDISRHAHGVARSPSPQSLLTHLYASRLARAQNLGRDGQVDPRHHLPKRHTAYRTENALFRGMVGEFAPPRWAKLVVVGGDSAYGSKDNMRMVQDRDKAALSRRWGFVFAIARTWKTVEEKRSNSSRRMGRVSITNAHGFPESTQAEAARSFGRIRLVCVCVMLGSHCGAEQKRA